MKILLGITGSVSAYKTPWLVRDLRRAGHDVRVVMTPSAAQFVTPLALEATSTHPVIIDPYAPEIQEGGSWHVHLGHWADGTHVDRKSTRLNSSHPSRSRMPSSA